MNHAIPKDRFGPLTAPMAHAVDTCVHCGFCLAACPTYRELGQEMDSPRGRIVLMKQVLEGNLSVADAQPHIDRCLGCLACEPACPSGVPYRDLISPFRAITQDQQQRTFGERLRRFLTAATLPYPARMRIAARVGQWSRFARPLLPRVLQPMLDLLPAAVPPRQKWPDAVPAQGTRRARVALLTGCAQDVLAPDITAAALAVLSRQGVEVVIPKSQRCCGGLAWHTGDLAAAQGFARRNLAAFPEDVDAVVTTAAGCGSALHEYGLILAGTAEADRAAAFASRVRDVSDFLDGLGPATDRPRANQPLRIAYHDACHLSNAQGVRSAPRRLLEGIENVELCEIADGHLCCGSAGTYNLDQPDIAAALGRDKARKITETGATIVATGNIGCLMQVEAHLRQAGSPVRVRHTLQVLRDAQAGSLG